MTGKCKGPGDASTRLSSTSANRRPYDEGGTPAVSDEIGTRGQGWPGFSRLRHSSEPMEIEGMMHSGMVFSVAANDVAY